MRKLILLADDLYVHAFLESGALDALAAQGSAFVVTDAVNVELIGDLTGLLEPIHDPQDRWKRFWELRLLLMAAFRLRSTTFRIKLRQVPKSYRARLYLRALPGIRRFTVRRALRELGINEDLDRLLRSHEPDLVIAPSDATDPIVLDLLRSAAGLNSKTLVIMNGWDNISSKTVFPVAPDFLGVWGQHSVEDAERIHGIPPERVFTLGSPRFDEYFSFDHAETPSPHPFPYVLFAGCALPFDELTALRRLDRILQREGPEEMRIVYRPHPWRSPRLCDDAFNPSEYGRVVIDPQVKDAYEASLERNETLTPEEFTPSQDYYPALLGHAAAVVCPLSTMTLEAALFGRPVQVLAYDDQVHPMPPSEVARYDHFRGIDQIEGLRVTRRIEDLEGGFRSVLTDSPSPEMREQVRPWIHFDNASYAERLQAAVDEIERRISPTGFRPTEPIRTSDA